MIRQYRNSEVIEIISEYIHNERDRGIMIRRLTDQATIERIAEEYDMSTSQVKRIIKKCSEEIFRHIPEERN